MTQKSKSNPINIIPTEDGLHLDESILWFDSEKSGEISFLSSALTNISARGPQVIATEETVKILEAKNKKPKALICQYNRPFSIGRLKMELLPSGHILGGALLCIEVDNEKILYAPSIQTQKTSTVRQVQLKKASTLILAAKQPYPKGTFPNRNKEKERLLQSILNSIEKGIYPIVQCHPSTTAQELTKYFCDNQIPLAVHPTIHRINRVYEYYNFDLGNYSLYSRKRTKNKVLLFPFNERGKGILKSPLPEGPVFLIRDTLEQNTNFELFNNVTDQFCLASRCDARELKDIIAKVAPKNLLIFGPYAKQYVSDLKNCAPVVKPLYSNHQPTLF